MMPLPAAIRPISPPITTRREMEGVPVIDVLVGGLIGIPTGVLTGGVGAIFLPSGSDAAFAGCVISEMIGTGMTG